MKQYIPKDTLVAEMENLENTYKKCPTRNSYEDGLKEGRLIGYKDALYKINTLEVKEVDLNEEIEKCLKQHNMLAVGKKDFTDIAEHFFELGLSVNSPITAADRGTAEEIVINLKRVEQDYRIDLTKEMEWVRNQAQKGE